MRSKLIIVISIISFAALISCKDKAAQAPSIFKIHFLNGDVRIEGKTKKTASIGTVLDADDTVITGKTSNADILIESSGIIRVMEQSRLTISSVMSNDNEIKTSVKLNEGKIFASFGKITKKSSHSVNTPFAVAAVRGTSFRVSADKDKSVIDVVAGKVQVNAVKDNTVVEASSKIIEENNSASIAAKELVSMKKPEEAVAVTALRKDDLKEIQSETAGISAPANTPSEIIKELENAGIAKGEPEKEPEAAKKETSVQPKGPSQKELAAKAQSEKAEKERIMKENALKEKLEQERIAKEKAEELKAQQKKAQQKKAQETKENRVKNIPNI